MTALKKQMEEGAALHNEDSCVGVFETHTEAENAIKELQRAGYDMKKLSIIGKDYRTEEHAVGYYNTGDRVKFWGGNGAFWGGLWGVLFSSAFMVIPGFGHLIIAGPFVSMLIGALEGATVVGGLSALGAALYSIGIPKDSVVKYETALKSNKFVLVVHGTGEALLSARQTLENAGGSDVQACTSDKK